MFNIGSGVAATLNDMAAAVRREIPGAVIEIGPGLNFLKSAYPMCNIYDVSRAREELGFKPQFDMDAGVADYVRSLKQLKA